MKKRILAAVLACITALGVAGCAKNENSGASVSSDSAGTSSDASNTSSGDSSTASEDSGASSGESGDSSAESESSDGNTGASEHKYKLSNPNATESAAKVYDYICENFGKTMMAGQQESTWNDGNNPDYEMEMIESWTGKLPAVRGFDFMKEEWDDIVTRATAWWEKGGIVTICWHTGINSMGTDGYKSSYEDVADWDKLFDENSEEHKAMLAHWDDAAAALARLQDAGVPVLWRPFHEFDGDFFWWAKGENGEKTDDGQYLTKLWKMMYDYYTNEKGLNNLIWVYGYGGTVKEGWYVGDEYCDIIGSDRYSYREDPTNKEGWAKLLANASENKPMAYHECGNLVPSSKFEEDSVIWSWFMSWHSSYAEANVGKRFGEDTKELYNSELVITLDELPSFK